MNFDLWLALQILLAVILFAMAILVGVTLWGYLFGPSVIRKLTNKYLLKRRIAWVSLIAVVLCTAMVIVVISIMGGWLRMFRESFHGLSGDIIIEARSMSGFSRYEEMIDRIEALRDVEAAAPVIETWGLMKLNGIGPDAVRVVGYPIDKIGRINGFDQSLYRQYQQYIDRGEQPPCKPSFDLVPGIDYNESLGGRVRNADQWPGIILGAGLARVRKTRSGEIDRPPPSVLLRSFVRLEVLGMDEDTISVTDAKPTAANYWVVDDSRTQIWQYDANTVYVPFERIQEDLKMHARTETDADTGEKFELRARTTQVHIKVKDGVDMYAVKPQVAAIVKDYYPIDGMDYPPVVVQTWEESQATYLSAVENEKTLVTFLFGIISIVAIFLIFCIFYMIVVEKTKDIGIIKSVGATNAGVAGIFLGYGLTIGVIGAGLGLLAAYLIVHNINEIHTWIADTFGRPIWDPEVYAFDTIPNTMNSNEVIVIMIVAVVSSVLGALVPAWRAAQMHPVDSLRWE